MSAYSDFVASLNPVAYYRHGESSGVVADDVGSNNLDGVIVGAPTLGAQGALLGDADTAITFSGTAQYITVPDANPLDLGNTFTLVTWVNRNATGAAGLIAKQASYRLEVAAAGTGHLIRLRNAGTATIISSTVAFTDLTKWHLIIAWKDGSSGAGIQLDGVDVSGTFTDSTLADSSPPASSALLLAANTAAAQFLNGSQDDTALFNYVLSPAQCYELWAVGRGRKLDLATESDSAASLTRRKIRVLDIATESSTTPGLGKRKEKALLEAEETDEALPLTAQKRQTLAQAQETDAAGDLTVRKERVLERAEETDTAPGLTSAKQRALDVASETDSAPDVTSRKVSLLALAEETDEALTITRPGQTIVQLDLAEETDQALDITPVTQFFLPVPSGGWRPIRRIKLRQTILLALAEETDEALALTSSKHQSERQTQEEEDLFAIGSY